MKEAIKKMIKRRKMIVLYRERKPNIKMRKETSNDLLSDY